MKGKTDEDTKELKEALEAKTTGAAKEYEKLYHNQVKGQPAEVTIPYPTTEKTAVGDTMKVAEKATKPAVKLVATEAEAKATGTKTLEKLATLAKAWAKSEAIGKPVEVTLPYPTPQPKKPP